MAGTNGEIVISCRELPAGDRPFAEFRDTTFFRIHGSTRNLPTPEEVRAKASGRWQAGRPPPVVFQDLGLLVKFDVMSPQPKRNVCCLLKNTSKIKSLSPKYMGGGLRATESLYICSM